MPISASFAGATRFVDRISAALTDPKRADRAVAMALFAFVVVWAAYATFSKAAQGLHPDMTELVAWSRDPAFGYLKHPPLAAWLVWGWFALFPVAEWSYYLLAAAMPAVALWFAWRIAGDHLPPERRAAALLLLMFVPFFTFHALKYNVNTVLMPTWAATTFCFLRSYRTLSLRWAALAGMCAALTMLGKYWSVFLLAGLFLAAVADARRAAYFRSAAPYLTAVAGLLVLGPHLYWLKQNDFAPFTYAMVVHGEKSLTDTLRSVAGYLGGSAAYVAVPLAVAAVLARGRLATLRDMAWPRDRDLRLVALVFWLGLLLPIAGAVAGRSEITSLWSMPAWTLLPVLLLAPAGVAVAPVDIKRLVAAAVALPLLLVLASPVIAYLSQKQGPSPASAHAHLLALEAERLWRLRSPAPLRYVGGEADLAYDVVTYAADRPRALTDMPPPDLADLARAGFVWVCFADSEGCRREGAARAMASPGGQTVESSITRSVMRQPGAIQRYTLYVIPPPR